MGREQSARAVAKRRRRSNDVGVVDQLSQPAHGAFEK
jgi:hypothetical protein